MNRLRLFTLAAVLTGAATLSAQQFYLNIGGGLSSERRDNRCVGAFKAGVAYEYEFNQHWTFSPALLFCGKGWKEKDREVPFLTPDGKPEYDEQGNQRMSVMSRSVSANYLEIPLMVRCYLRTGNEPDRYLILGMGPYVACGLNGKIKTKGDTSRPGSEKIYYDTPTFRTEGYHRFDMGLQAMLGYQCTRHLTIGIEAELGLLRVNSSGARTEAGLISLSYRLGR